eukprot:UN10196
MGLITSMSSFQCANVGVYARMEYISSNIICVVLLYAFKDSQLNKYINSNKLFMNLIFHSIQISSILAYALLSFKDAGVISLDHHDEDDHDFNIPSDAEQDSNDILIGPNRVKPATPMSMNHKYIQVFANDNAYEFTVNDTIPDYNKRIILDRKFEAGWPSNFCAECDFIRPLRSKHCRICKQCVAKWDHHCTLANNCVGG